MFVYWPFFSSRDLVFISTFMLLCLELEKFSLFYDTKKKNKKKKHTFWYVTMVVTIETTAPKRRLRKTPFWSTLDTLIFLLFSNLCCLGSCAAVATLKQMLANNCYETFDRSVFFDLGPRTTPRWWTLLELSRFMFTQSRDELFTNEKDCFSLMCWLWPKGHFE